jgi:hypothetical protein
MKGKTMRQYSQFFFSKTIGLRSTFGIVDLFETYQQQQWKSGRCVQNH